MALPASLRGPSNANDGEFNYIYLEEKEEDDDEDEHRKT
jgi:hypothetical protein